MRRLTLRTKIMRGIVAPFFAVLAVLSVIFGIANATFWKPNDVVIAYTHVSGTRYIVTDPGVLNLVDNRVRVSVAALRTRRPICVAVGLTKDVRGWVAGSPVQRITGLRDWNNLSVKKVAGKTFVHSDYPSNTADEDVPFRESNLWSNVTCQLGLAKFAINTSDYVQTAGSASYDHAVATGAVKKSGTREKNNSNHRDTRSVRLRSQAARRVLLIDLGDNVPSASIELRWRRHQVPDFATPLYFMAALFAVLALLAATIFAMAPHRRRNKQLVASRSGVLTVKPSRSEEVTFAEAFAGSWANMLARKRHKNSGCHARHGAHSRRNKSVEENVNNVYDSKQVRTASASTAVSPTDSLAETTVISQDELIAFASRFMQQHDLSDDSAFKSNNSFEYLDADSSYAVEESSDLHNADSNNINSDNQKDAKNRRNYQNKKNTQNQRVRQNRRNNRNLQDSKQDNKDSQNSQNLDNQNPHDVRNKKSLHNNQNNLRDKRAKRNKQDSQNKRDNQNSQNSQHSQNDNGKRDNHNQTNQRNKQHKQYRSNRRGNYDNGNSGRYRKNSKGYRGNSSNERGNEQ